MYEKFGNQSSLAVNTNELSPDVLQSLYAQLMLEYSLFKRKKQQFEQEIDRALEANNRIQFYALTNNFNDFMEEHQEGIILYEKGVQVQVFFK